MRIITSILFLTAIIIFIDGCKDDDPTLPPVTATGQNTFGCIIDGNIYVPQGAYAGPSVDATFERIVVYGGQQKVNLQLIVVDTLHRPIVTNQAYYFNQRDVTCVFEDARGKGGCDYWETPVTGYVKFARIDFANNVISGVFEFSAFSPDCNKAVEITDGRFDIRTDM